MSPPLSRAGRVRVFLGYHHRVMCHFSIPGNVEEQSSADVTERHGKGGLKIWRRISTATLASCGRSWQPSFIATKASLGRASGVIYRSTNSIQVTAFRQM